MAIFSSYTYCASPHINQHDDNDGDTYHFGYMVVEKYRDHTPYSLTPSHPI